MTPTDAKFQLVVANMGGDTWIRDCRAVSEMSSDTGNLCDAAHTKRQKESGPIKRLAEQPRTELRNVGGCFDVGVNKILI